MGTKESLNRLEIFLSWKVTGILKLESRNQNDSFNKKFKTGPIFATVGKNKLQINCLGLRAGLSPSYWLPSNNCMLKFCRFQRLKEIWHHIY